MIGICLCLKEAQPEEVELQQDEAGLQQEEEEPLKSDNPPVDVKSAASQKPVVAIATRYSTCYGVHVMTSHCIVACVLRHTVAIHVQVCRTSTHQRCASN